jgi:hypothetical protein
VRRKVNENVRRDHREPIFRLGARSRFFAHGDQLSADGDRFALARLAADGHLKEVQAVGDFGLRIDVDALAGMETSEGFVELFIYGRVQRVPRSDEN